MLLDQSPKLDDPDRAEGDGRTLPERIGYLGDTVDLSDQGRQITASA